MVDGNHMLAGQNLKFNVEVVAIREATEEELAHGHVHGAHDHHHDHDHDGCCGGHGHDHGHERGGVSSACDAMFDGWLAFNFSVSRRR